MIIPSSYPAQGILYFLGHPQLLTNLICPILLTIIWAIGVIIFGFAYLLQLQAHALIDANCPEGLAWFVSVIFVLLEIALMIILFYLIILPIYQDGLFDRVLKLRGLRHVLENSQGNDMVKCMRGVNGGIFILFCQIVVLIVTLPLNLIPVLGQILYATINGWILTFGIRFHYDAEIRNISVKQSRSEAWRRRAEYTGFGSVAVALEMIPIANLLFMWTNIVGCALWVADEIEREERLQQQQQIAQSSGMGGPSSAGSGTASLMGLERRESRLYGFGLGTSPAIAQPEAVAISRSTTISSSSAAAAAMAGSVVAGIPDGARGYGRTATHAHMTFSPLSPSPSPPPPSYSYPSTFPLGSSGTPEPTVTTPLKKSFKGFFGKGP